MRIITTQNIQTSFARPTINTNHKQAVHDKLIATLEVARVKLGYIKPMPVIEYTLRGKTAGYAWFGLNKIQLNPTFLVNHFDDMINNVVVHELAHLIAYDIYKDKGHGYYWKHVMLVLGIEPKRCHSYDTSKVGNNMTYHIYTCGCKETLAPVRRHNNIQKGKWRYYPCSECGRDFRYTGKVTNKAEVVANRGK